MLSRLGRPRPASRSRATEQCARRTGAPAPPRRLPGPCVVRRGARGGGGWARAVGLLHRAWGRGFALAAGKRPQRFLCASIVLPESKTNARRALIFGTSATCHSPVLAFGGVTPTRSPSQLNLNAPRQARHTAARILRETRKTLTGLMPATCRASPFRIVRRLPLEIPARVGYPRAPCWSLRPFGTPSHR